MAIWKVVGRDGESKNEEYVEARSAGEALRAFLETVEYEDDHVVLVKRVSDRLLWPSYSEKATPESSKA